MALDGKARDSKKRRTDMEERLLDQLERKRGKRPFCGRNDLIRGVALHPRTFYKCMARGDSHLLQEPVCHGEPIRLNGFRVVTTRLVDEGDLRLIPAADVSYPGSRQGQPCPWPAFTIEKPEHGDWRLFQPGTTVNESGQLQERSGYLDPAFDHRNSNKLTTRP